MSTPKATSTEHVHEGEVIPPNGKRGGKNTALAKRETATIAPVEQPRITIEQMVMKALDMNQPELIDKFMAIYEKQETERKKAAFTAAMARAQARILPVAANATNDHTRSVYAKLDAINRAIAPIYGQEGLAISFRTGDAKRPGDERIIAVIMHEGGHIDDSHYIDLPRDDRGSQGNTNKTELHAIGSTNTYGRRYLTLMIFNVAIGALDDDGNGGRVSPQQARQQKNQGKVAQPREKPSTQQEGDIKPFAERPQLEPVSESGEAITKSQADGYKKAMAHAFKGYGDNAAKIAWAEFQKRFPKIEKLSDVPATPEAQKIILNWIADPQRN